MGRRERAGDRGQEKGTGDKRLCFQSLPVSIRMGRVRWREIVTHSRWFFLELPRLQASWQTHSIQQLAETSSSTCTTTSPIFSSIGPLTRCTMPSALRSLRLTAWGASRACRIRCSKHHRQDQRRTSGSRFKSLITGDPGSRDSGQFRSLMRR